MTDFTTGQWAYRGKPTEPVTILTTQRPGDWPILAMRDNGQLTCHLADGRQVADRDLDLVPLQTPRQPVEGWVNVYQWGRSEVYYTREEADRHAGNGRIACVFVRETEGGK